MALNFQPACERPGRGVHIHVDSTGRYCEGGTRFAGTSSKADSPVHIYTSTYLAHADGAAGLH